MEKQTETARIRRMTITKYRQWARDTGRNLTDLMDIVLLFGLRHQSEVEREVAMKLEPRK